MSNVLTPSALVTLVEIGEAVENELGPGDELGMLPVGRAPARGSGERTGPEPDPGRLEAVGTASVGVLPDAVAPLESGASCANASDAGLGGSTAGEGGARERLRLEGWVTTGESCGEGDWTSTWLFSDAFSAWRMDEKESRDTVLEASWASSIGRSSLLRPLPRFDTLLIIFPNERNMVADLVRHRYSAECASSYSTPRKLKGRATTQLVRKAPATWSRRGPLSTHLHVASAGLFRALEGFVRTNHRAGKLKRKYD